MTYAKHRIGFSLAGTALGLVLSTAAPASAQTVITQEPAQQSTTIERTTVRERVVPAAPRKADTARKARTVTTVRTTQPRNTVRTTTRERIVTTPMVRERVVTSPPARSVVVDGPLELSPSERSVVYRTIVGQPTPRVVVTEPREPVVSERVFTSPDRRPLVTTVPDDEVVTGPMTTRRAIVAPSETTGFEPAESVELVVGTRVPPSVALYDLPSSTAAAVPTLAQYRYARVNDRVYLVDPQDDVIVAELYR